MKKTKEKLTSVLALILAVSMVLSTGAMAAEVSAGEDVDYNADSSYVENSEDTAPAEEPAETPADGEEAEDVQLPAEEPETPEDTQAPEDAQASDDTQAPEDAQTPDQAEDQSAEEPQEELTDPLSDAPDEAAAQAPEEEDFTENLYPELMAGGGWHMSGTHYVFQYTDKENTHVVAGSGFVDANDYQILYLPELKCGSETMDAGFYLFHEKDGVACWANDANPQYPDNTPVNVAIVRNIDIINTSCAVSNTYPYRALQMKDGIGTLYSGRLYDKNNTYRFDKGVGWQKFHLGTDNKLYYYTDGCYTGTAAKNKLAENDGFHKFDGKWYHATAASLSNRNAKGHLSPNAPIADNVFRTTNGILYKFTDGKAVAFTGYRKSGGKMYKYTSGKGVLFTGSYNGIRYTKGALYQGWGLSGTALCYYVGGKFKTAASLTQLKSNGKFHKYPGANGKWYVATEASLKNYKAVIANNVYRKTNGKMYKFTAGKAALFTGRYDGVRYTKGAPYQGWGLGTEKVPCLYYYVNGKFKTATALTQLKTNGKFHKYPGANGKWYVATAASLKKYKAVVANNVFRMTDGKMYKFTAGKAALFTGTHDDARYTKGVPFEGWGLSGTALCYYVKGKWKSAKSLTQLKSNGGFHQYGGKWYYASAAALKNYKAVVANNVYQLVNKKLYKYANGARALFTGSYKGYPYRQGVKLNYKGWTNLGGKTYYYRNGMALTGWQYLKSKYNGKVYKYFFRSDGSQVKDMFKHFGNSYLSKKLLLQVNRTTHTADILLWDKEKKSYCIAAKSFVCSTCKEASHFDPGTFTLSKSHQKRWLSFDNPDNGQITHYQYGTWVVGNHAWLHSPQYKVKGDIYSLNVNNYNKLGTNQSYYCIRLHVINVLYIYKSVKKMGKQKAKLYSSGNKGPYGKITLKGSTGYQSKSKRWDPTDPAVKKA